MPCEINVTTESKTKSYNYDDTGKLIGEYAAKGAGIPVKNKYEYDLRGNRIKMIGEQPDYFITETTDYEYDLNNRLVSSDITVLDEENSTTEWYYTDYYYDSNGNMTAKQKTQSKSAPAHPFKSDMILSGRDRNTDTEIYRYDSFNRLTNYNKGRTEASYTYNADNLRTSKTVNRNKTEFAWNGQNLALETNVDTVNAYTYDVTGIHIANQNGDVTSYLKDSHGNVVGITDAVGTVINEMDYDAFGNRWQSSAPSPFGYCGEYYDSESGNIYLRNRYYDSTTGRFISEDPVKDGLNWYSYCNGNPVAFVDPSGWITDEEQEMYENGEMAPGAYSYLMKLTYNYYLADKEEDREYYNKLANDFRESGYEKTPFDNWNSVIDNMASKPSKLTVAEWEHYYRNNLNIEFSYDDLMKLNDRLPEHLKWTDNVAADLHQNHTNGGDNVKYVSADGHFEIVYNANNEIQNQYNNTDDMGTYNYCSPKSDPIGHFAYDVVPYGKYGNVTDDARRTP